MTTIDTSPEAIAALLDGVTPGPWEEITPSDGIWPPRVFSGRSIISMVDNSDMLHLEKVANASFIAAARELVPALAAEIARLTAERDRLVMALAETEALEMQHGEVIRRVMAERDAAWNAAIRASAELIRHRGETGLGDKYSDYRHANAILALLKPEEKA